MSTLRTSVGIALIGIVSMPLAAWANAGVPMLFVTWPAMGIALVPVIAVEIAVVKSVLAVRVSDVAGLCVVANVLSTLVGVPIAWVLYVVFEFAFAFPVAGHIGWEPGAVMTTILSAGWLGPDEKNLDWMIPLASMVLLAGFFVVSYWIEAAVATRMLKGTDPKRIRAAMWRANLASYALLEGLAAVALVYALVVRQLHAA